MEPTPSRPFVFITTTELRDNLSETMSRATYANQTVVVTRRGSKIAAIVSFHDALFLENMKKRRDSLLNAPLPTDPAQVGQALAERLKYELLFWDT